MTKFRKSILIFGILVLIIGAALGTFIVLSLTGSLKTDAIELEFTVDYAQKEYDGEPLKASSYQITAGFPVAGHSPVVTFTGEQTDVGNGFSGLEVKMVNENGYDVTREYDIRVVPGVLAVNQCPLRVALTAHDVHYDGAIVDIGDGYTVTGGNLVRGHRLMLQIKDEWFAVTGTTIAGETLTAGDFDLYILDANGRNVTGNYAVAPPTGRVNIIQRPIVLTPVSATKTYDGKPLTCTDYKIETGSLASGQYIVADYRGINGGSAEVTTVNTDNPLEIVVAAKIYDINDNDVTDNYTIRTNSGYLTVNKAPLTVNLNPISVDYGDEIKSEFGYTITSTVSDLELKFNETDYLDKLFESVAEIGSTSYTISGFTISDNSGDITSMFNITVVPGLIKISPRKVLIVGNTLSKTYDGNLIFTDDLPKIDTLVNNHVLDSITCASNNEGGYYVKAISLVDEQGNNVNGYYNITNFGADFDVTIGQRNVAISSDTLEKPYDGTPLSGGDLRWDSLAEGDRFVYTPCQITFVKESDKKNKPDDLAIYNRNGEDVTEFYAINDTNCGTLNITKCQLSITIEQCSTSYGLLSSLNDENMTHLLKAACDINGYTELEIKFVDAAGKVLTGEDLEGIVEFEETAGWTGISRLDVAALGERGIYLVLCKNGKDFYTGKEPDTANFEFPQKIEGLVMIDYPEQT